MNVKYSNVNIGVDAVYRKSIWKSICH